MENGGLLFAATVSLSTLDASLRWRMHTLRMWTQQSVCIGNMLALASPSSKRPAGCQRSVSDRAASGFSSFSMFGNLFLDASGYARRALVLIVMSERRPCDQQNRGGCSQPAQRRKQKRDHGLAFGFGQSHTAASVIPTTADKLGCDRAKFFKVHACFPMLFQASRLVKDVVTDSGTAGTGREGRTGTACTTAMVAAAAPVATTGFDTGSGALLRSAAWRLCWRFYGL